MTGADVRFADARGCLPVLRCGLDVASCLSVKGQFVAVGGDRIERGGGLVGAVQVPQVCRREAPLDAPLENLAEGVRYPGVSAGRPLASESLMRGGGH